MKKFPFPRAWSVDSPPDVVTPTFVAHQAVDEAMQMFSRGYEKVDVIHHLLTSLFKFQSTGSDHGGFVGLLEFHPQVEGRYYVHILSHQPVTFLESQELICEKYTPRLASLSDDDSASSSQRNLNRHVKPKRAKSIFAKPMRHRSTAERKSFMNNSTKPDGNTDDVQAAVPGTTFHVYECTSKTVLDQVREMLFPESLDGIGIFSYNTAIANPAAIASLTNGFRLVQTLYRKRHKEREEKLKERIFNEVISTMTLPLVVFDVRNTVLARGLSGGKKSVANFRVDPKQMQCIYFNQAFRRLTDRRHGGRDPADHGDSDSDEVVSTFERFDSASLRTRGSSQKLTEMEVGPQDMQYRDENHHLFSRFLEYPEIYDALLSVMHKHPLTLMTSSSSGLDDDIETHSSSSSSEGASATLSLEYGDDLIPQSHYEIDIYRVNGTRVGVVIRDVSEKMHHLQLIEQASKAKSQFLANINHEFRTPLNSIDGNLQLLARTYPLTSRQEDLIHRMRLAETALMSLLQEVLDYAKLEQRRVQLNEEPFSLRHCIEAALDVLQTVIHEKRNQVSLKFDLSVPTVVVGDSWRLQQILVNLITNANKFTTNGNVDILVKLETRPDSPGAPGGPVLTFTVSDTGEGIPKKIRGNLFNAWVQAETLYNRSGCSGAGLGLAICKELCKLMGGDIWLEKSICRDDHPSVDGDSGTVFKFYLPLAAADDEENLNMAQEELDLLNGKTALVLVLDDTAANAATPSTRQTLIKALLDWKIRPTPCTTTEEAKNFLLAGFNFDVVLVGPLCHSCADVDLDDPKVEQGSGQLVKFATWATFQYPHLPLVGLGDNQSVHDADCVKLFRKVISTPLVTSNVFHVLGNLFTALDSKSHRKTSGGGYALEPRRQTPVSMDMKSVSGGSMSEARRFSDIRVLIVEDVAANQVVLKEMLESMGCHRITVVENGKEMLQLVDQGYFDVIFLDLLMPVMSGMEAIKIFRETHPLGTAPFVVATTATSIISPEKDKYQQQGMDAFIQKPIKMTEIKALLNVFANMKEQQQQG